jgi:mRNA-degrading endonuclease RelE of RelBE toxin-antitoxin system
LSKVQFRESAEREFGRLSRVQQKAIYDKLRSLESDPRPTDSKELEGFAPLRRIKASDVRAIYDPEPDSKDRIFIWRIGTDHSIYALDELFKEYQSDAAGDC